MAKTKEFTIPKKLAEAADLLYTTRERRLEIQKQADALEEQEKQIKKALLAGLPKGEASGIAGKVARVSIVTKEVPTVADWDAFYAHIKKTGAFELLQRRVSNEAVSERWEEGKPVPGVEKFSVDSISLSKVA